MFSARNVFAIAFWEAKRPLRKKTTSWGLVTLIVSALLFGYAFPDVNLSSDLSVNVGSQGLYKVKAQGELAELILKSPKFMIVDSLEDIALTTDGVLVSHGPLPSEKSQMALRELVLHIEAENELGRKRQVDLRDKMMYVTSPIWVIIRNKTGRDRDDLLAYRENLQAKKGSDFSGSVTPENIELELPFSPMAKYFLVFTPLLFFSIYSAASIIREKIKRSGVYLLTAPVTSFEIVSGKILPYALISFGLVLGIGALQDMDLLPLSIAFFPIAFLCLALAHTVAVLSNTPHDLNMTLTFVFMLVFAFVFYPAMFHELSNVSLISPLGSLLAYEDKLLDIWDLIVLNMPITLSAFAVFSFGCALYREDVLFTHRHTVYKLYESFRVFMDPRLGRTGPYLGMALVPVLLIPLIYLLQLFIIFLMLPFGLGLIYPSIFLIAYVEEACKIFGVAALTRLGAIKGGIKYGAYAGLAFYLGERVLTAKALAHMIGTPGAVILLVPALLLTMFTHVICSAIAGYGVKRTGGRPNLEFGLWIVLAAVIHGVYNYLVIFVFNGP